jgi:branched-chain amino acid transport system substrate-binding protein
LATPAQAQIKIGAIISITGPTAAQGVGYKNAFELLPMEMDGLSVTYLVRDDGGDPTAAVSIARKLITEDHVDAFIGPAISPSVASVLPIATEAEVPMVAMSPNVIDTKLYPYGFADAQPIKLMVEGVVAHMKAHGVKTVGFIGFSDGWGDNVWNALNADIVGTGIDVVDGERYSRSDTSVQPQVLKALSHHPDAIMLGGSATPGALPNIALTQRAFKGQVYNNHGVVSGEYIRVGGAAVEGCIAPTGPLVVYDQLPDSNPVKPVATAFMQRYIEKFGPQSRNAFAGYTYDAAMIIQAGIPVALKSGKPGTPAFRERLKSGMEQVHELVGTHGVYNMSPTDHVGMDARARVMVQVTDGAWKLIQ